MGFISSSAGISLAALFILMGNMITTLGSRLDVYYQSGSLIWPSFFYTYTRIMSILEFLPNWSMIRAGFIVLGITFILLGSTSIALFEKVPRIPSSTAAGIVSIIGAIGLIIGGLIFPIKIWASIGGMFFSWIWTIIWLIIISISFLLILVSFILVNFFHSTIKNFAPEK